MILMRPNPLPPRTLIRLFLKGSVFHSVGKEATCTYHIPLGTINELEPMRALCKKAVSIVLKLYKPPANTIESPMSICEYKQLMKRARHTPLSNDEWNSAVFIDCGTMFLLLWLRFRSYKGTVDKKMHLLPCRLYWLEWRSASWPC